MPLTKVQSGLVNQLASDNLPAGSVLQVVSNAYATVASNSSTTFADSGLSVTITPKFSTSKILVFVDLAGCFANATTTSLVTRLVRNSTSILQIDAIAGYTNGTGNGSGGVGANCLDSPATTSSTIYKVQIATGTAGNLAYINATSGGTSTSTITAMEIAA